MISITTAANTFRRVTSSSSTMSNRLFGSHFKAFGSGRIAVSSTEEEQNLLNDNNDREFFGKHKSYCLYLFRTISLLVKMFGKITVAFCRVFYSVFPSLTNSDWQPKQHLHSSTFSNTASLFHKLNDKTVVYIFSYVSPVDLLSLKATCKKFRKIIDSNANKLPKFSVDQIKLHFDEGEVIIYPLDEKIVPIRYAMPPIENFTSRFRHISTLSLFLRGLIPIETAPILKRLVHLRLDYTQIYFLWCEFGTHAEEYLTDLLHANVEKLTDIGFEICSPPQVISDRLLQHNLKNLTSLRVWNENGSYQCYNSTLSDCEQDIAYAITDSTLLSLAKHCSTGNSQLEIIDLARVNCSIEGMLTLISAWYTCPSVNNLNIGFHNCIENTYNMHKNQNNKNVRDEQYRKLIKGCAKLHIPIKANGITHPNGFRLTLSIT